MNSFDRRKELAAFLRCRRDRLAPSDFGFIGSKRRRSIGLLREEVAIICGVGLTWYTWLEQGRDIQVSESFLQLLANGLRLNATERAYLFLLAQLRPPPLLPEAKSVVTTENIQEMLDLIGAPAYARNQYFDVIAWNSANTSRFGDFSAVAASERNVAWLMFTRPRYQLNMPNWQSDARAIVATLRVSAAENGYSPALARLVEDLTARSPEFKRLWNQHDVSYSGEGVTQIISDRDEVTHFRSHTLTPDMHPDLRIVIFEEKLPGGLPPTGQTGK